MTSRKLTFVSDPGHGWLSVSHKDLLTLGIADSITPYSYMNLTRAWLEEDCDAGIFERAAENAGWQLTIKDSQSKNGPRHLAAYNSHWVHNPLVLGSRVRCEGAEYTVLEIGRRYIGIGHKPDQFNYNLIKSNPYRGILPPVANLQ